MRTFFRAVTEGKHSSTIKSMVAPAPDDGWRVPNLMANYNRISIAVSPELWFASIPRD